MRPVDVALLALLVSATAFSSRAGAFEFADHWRQPIAIQGPAPAGFDEIESSLDPEDCGQCHESQYSDWIKSRHASASGPGLMGQTHPPFLDETTIEMCLDCHAPLGEQRMYVRTEKGGYTKNLSLDNKLLSKGVTCAGCHVRKHKRYGPAPKKPVEPPLPHGGFVTVENFGSSRFCRPCHQFEKHHRRINGKLVEDTYEQWKKSEYSKRGVSCAGCHMPERRHLWKGIHDPAMVKKGVRIEAVKRGRVVRVTVTNSGVGHCFPTYVTPMVVVRSAVTLHGKTELVDEKYIGWSVELDLSKENFDTRIRPGQSVSFDFNMPDKAVKGKFTVAVIVYPDRFYNRFFRWILDTKPEGADLAMIGRAFEDTQKSRYVLFSKSWRALGPINRSGLSQN